MIFDTLDDVANHDLRFHKVIVDTEILGTLFIFWLAEGRQHHNLDITCFWCIAQDIQDERDRRAEEKEVAEHEQKRENEPQAAY